MSRSEITRADVLAAMRECNDLGRESFLGKYGYGPATAYRIRHRGRLYDPKAILGVAVGLHFGCEPPKLSRFSGGAEHCCRLLASLGFRIYHHDTPVSVAGLADGARLVRVEVAESERGFVVHEPRGTAAP